MRLSKHGPRSRTQDPVETQQVLSETHRVFRRSRCGPSRRHSPALGSILCPAGHATECRRLRLHRPRRLWPQRLPPFRKRSRLRRPRLHNPRLQPPRRPPRERLSPLLHHRRPRRKPSPRQAHRRNRPAKRSTSPLALRMDMPSSPSSPRGASFSSPSGPSKCGPVRPPRHLLCTDFRPAGHSAWLVARGALPTSRT